MQKTDLGKLTWSNPSGKIIAGKLIPLFFWILFIINLFYENSVFRVYSRRPSTPTPNIVKSKIFKMIDMSPCMYLFSSGEMDKYENKFHTITDETNWQFLYFKKRKTVCTLLLILVLTYMSPAMQSSIRLFIFSYVLQPRTMERLFKKETLINWLNITWTPRYMYV